MEIDDTPAKLAIGKLMVYAARSEEFYGEIIDFLDRTDIGELLLFQPDGDSHPEAMPFSLAPSQLLLDFLENLRRRSIGSAESIEP